MSASSDAISSSASPARHESHPGLTLRRGVGCFIAEDRDAGYCREIDDLEWARIGAQWFSLEYDRKLCEGKIPDRGAKEAYPQSRS
jgi:hypothetical protein